MTNFFQLLSDCRIDLRVGVAMNVGPDGRVSVEIAAALGIP